MYVQGHAATPESAADHRRKASGLLCKLFGVVGDRRAAHLRMVIQGHEGLLIGQADPGRQRGAIQALRVAALPAYVGSPGRCLCARRLSCAAVAKV